MMQSANAVPIEFGVVGAIAFTTLYVTLVVVRIRRRTARGVVRRLRRNRGTVQFRVGYIGGGWNPAGTRATGWTMQGPGVVTYELGPDGDVHATLEDRSGHVKHYQGPIPEYVDAHSPAQKRLRRMWRGVIYGYLALIVLGFAVGYAVASGSVVAKVLAGCIGIFAAMVVAAVLALVLRVVLAVRGLTRHDDPLRHS